MTRDTFTRADARTYDGEPEATPRLAPYDTAEAYAARRDAEIAIFGTTVIDAAFLARLMRRDTSK